MRFRILVIMMLALWIPLAGHAELAIDLSTATLEELLAARDAIQVRIEEIEKEAAEARISVGVYKIGVNRYHHQFYDGHPIPGAGRAH